MDILTSWRGIDEMPRLLVPVLIVSTIHLVFLIATHRRRWRQSRERSWSFASLNMIEGVLPSRIHAPEPILNVAVYLSSCPSVERLAETVVRSLLEYERLSTIPDVQLKRGRPLDSPMKPMDMIRQIEVNGDDDVTNKVVLSHSQDSFASRATSKPWWEVLVVKNKGRGFSACVFRMHHGLCDGLSMVHLFSRIISNEKGEQLDVESMAVSHRSGKRQHQTNPIIWLFHILREALHIVSLGMTRYDDDTVFSRRNHTTMVYSGRRSAVILPPIDVDLCKQLKEAAGVTFKDILLTAVSQAIHDYCESQNCQVLATRKSRIQCRTLLAVPLPRPADEWTDKSKALRNNFVMTSVGLGMGMDDIVDRLKFIQNQTMSLKTSPRVPIQDFIQNKIAPLLSTSMIAESALNIFSRNSLGFTNVAGPSCYCKLAGHRIESVQVFFPSILPFVAVVSYAGIIYGNIVLDDEVFKEANTLSRFYAAAFIQLCERFGVQVPSDLQSFAG